ncbi:MAG: tetratricopeptide repeat protein [Clostridia bacterium]|nr:tetratricopeptide repeat protein [Clostridia bacterium]
MKKRKIGTVIGIVIIVIAMLAVIALFLFETAEAGWVITSETVTKPALIFVGLVISLVKLITRTGGGLSKKRVLSAYQEQLSGVFARPDQKKHRDKLLTGIVRYNEDAYAQAIKIFESLEKDCNTASDYGGVLLFLALAYTDAGMIEDAIPVYERLLHYVPRHSVALSNLGILYSKQGRRDQAMDCYKKAIEIDGNNAPAYANLAQEYMVASAWEETVLYGQKALAINSNICRAEEALAIAYFALGDEEQSRLHFDRAVMHGGNAKTMSTLISELRQGKDPFAALRRDHEFVQRFDAEDDQPFVMKEEKR